MREPEWIARLTFPNGEHMPTLTAEQRESPPIAGNVAFPLLLPVASMFDRCFAFALAGVHVPKTSMHVDDLAEARKDNVGCAGEVASMEAEAIA